MSDIRTMFNAIIREMHQDVSSPGASIEADILRAITESLRFNRSIQTAFNTRRYQFSLNASQFIYPLPSDYLGLVGEVFYTPDSTSSYRYPLVNAGMDLVEELKYYMEGDYDEGRLVTGNPLRYAVEPNEKNMYLSPMPSTTTGLVHLRYLQDLGTPEFLYSGSAWVFYKPGMSGVSTETITKASTWTTKWLTEGYDAIRSRALFYLFTREYGGTEETDLKASRYLGQWNDAIKNLRTENTKRQANWNIRKWI